MENITSETIELIKDKIDEIINNSSDIDEKQRQIIRLRYGLDGKEPIKIRELAKMFKVSPKKMKEEVVSVEKKIFNKLKRDI